MKINNNSDLLFGGVTLSPRAANSLSRRLNCGEFGSVLPDMLKAQEANPVRVNFDTSGKLDKLYFTIKYLQKDGNLFFKYFSEGFFDRVFKNPMGFIRKAVAEADKAREELGI